MKKYLSIFFISAFLAISIGCEKDDDDHDHDDHDGHDHSSLVVEYQSNLV